MSHLVRLLLVVFLPLSYPFSKVIHVQSMDLRDTMFNICTLEIKTNLYFGILTMPAVGLPPWQRAFGTLKTSRAENIGGSACQ